MEPAWKQVVIGIQSDLPGFFGHLISGKMALLREGRADEKKSIHRRVDGRDPARGRAELGR
jgi:hypothetical protein